MADLVVREKDLTLFFKNIADKFKRLLEVAKENVLVGVKTRLNFKNSATATWNISDNPSTNSIDISIDSVGGGGGLSDADYGDITVSGGGTVMTIDANVVSNTKLRDSAAISVIGRSVNSVGDPADIAAASTGDVLRVAGAPPVLGFGAIPESSVTNLVTDLAGKVPTTRNLTASSPITGGGDLSADRSFGFDQTVALNNNARIKVSKNGTGTGVRREINFIEGTNVTITEVDDSGSEKVDVTINASSSGITVSSFSVTVPYSVNDYSVIISDASAGVASKILLFPATTADTATNIPSIFYWVSDRKAGNFTVTLKAPEGEMIGGGYDFYYILF